VVWLFLALAAGIFIGRFSKDGVTK